MWETRNSKQACEKFQTWRSMPVFYLVVFNFFFWNLASFTTFDQYISSSWCSGGYPLKSHQVWPIWFWPMIILQIFLKELKFIIFQFWLYNMRFTIKLKLCAILWLYKPAYWFSMGFEKTSEGFLLKCYCSKATRMKKNIKKTYLNIRQNT